jgi:hypothetical protein
MEAHATTPRGNKPERPRRTRSRSRSRTIDVDSIRAGPFYGAASLQAERALMIAVLENGVRCYLQLSGAREPRRRRRFLEADRWIRSRDQSTLFAFENICTVLGIDADRVRRNLRRRKNVGESTRAGQ